MRSSSRPIRGPDSDVSTTRPRHSRVKSSTAVSTRNRRPVDGAFDTKSSDERWLAASGNHDPACRPWRLARHQLLPGSAVGIAGEQLVRVDQVEQRTGLAA